MDYQRGRLVVSGALATLIAFSGDVLIGDVVAPGGGIFEFDTFSPTSVHGATIDEVRGITGGNVKLRFGLSAVKTATFISRLIVQDSTGAYQVLEAADATFSNPLGTRSRWEWSGDSVWTTTHASRTVQVHF
jgi:hypothetical protein